MRDDPTVVALVAGAKRGDQRSWNGLVERYAPLVWGVCRRYGLAEADAHDVGQTVWLRLVEHLATLREPAALPGWLITTTRRECAAVQRGVRERARHEQVDEAEIVADPESTAVDRWLVAEERGAALRAAFSELPPRCQQLLSLLLADPPVSYAEIGVRLGMPIGSIGPNRARCLNRLRQCRAITDLLGGGTDAGPRGTDGRPGGGPGTGGSQGGTDGGRGSTDAGPGGAGGGRGGTGGGPGTGMDGGTAGSGTGGGMDGVGPGTGEERGDDRGERVVGR